MVTALVKPDQNDKGDDQVPALFKFYEEAAEKTKALAWGQTTWILTLNAGIMAFSLDFYANHGTNPGLTLIEGIAAAVGVVLCFFLIYLLSQLGGHISHYWTSSNRLALASPQLAASCSQTIWRARAPAGGRRFPRSAVDYSSSLPSSRQRIWLGSRLSRPCSASWPLIPPRNERTPQFRPSMPQKRPNGAFRTETR